MTPLTAEEMSNKVCPMTVFLATPKPCIGSECMMYQKQYKLEAVRDCGDIEFVQKFKGFYCSLGKKRSIR